MTRAGVDRTGQRFGSIVVTGRAERPSGHRGHKAWWWSYLCDCGCAGTACSSNLKRKMSCPACSAARASAKNTTHGMSDTWLYRRWRGMHDRCYLPGTQRYERYGGRGIKVHPRWHEFSSFLQDLPPCPGRNFDLDRIDTDRDYEPGNIRWATKKDNARNRTNNRLLTCFGRTQCCAAWAEELGLTYSKINGRLRLGWSVERTLSTP